MSNVGRMGVDEYLAQARAAQSEAEYQAGVVHVARSLGWLTYHTRDSRGSEPGFPDLCMARDGRLIFAELKRSRGRLTRDQERWLTRLASCEPVETYIWRPGDPFPDVLR